ncbi:hypothetical protein [Pararhizobium sp. IMCC21322]|uniref:hypothetical protein n=1 Tax=Pararhizobium sp. IMCC21322 TaxID=3067903 RepID=UPI00274059AC|nr:hypothetical protein [Pararhizobium sp. IMCC21322]
MLTPKLRTFILRNKLTVGFCAASFLALIYFVGSFTAELIYFNDPRHQNEALKPWMTPRYVALSYDLPRETVREIFGFTEAFEGPRRMGFVAERLDVSLEDLTAMVRDAAQEYREQTND